MTVLAPVKVMCIREGNNYVGILACPLVKRIDVWKLILRTNAKKETEPRGLVRTIAS